MASRLLYELCVLCRCPAGEHVGERCWQRGWCWEAPPEDHLPGVDSADFSKYTAELLTGLGYGDELSDKPKAADWSAIILWKALQQSHKHVNACRST